ncbi:MAG TPA: hypothetical protein VGC47_04820 [Acidimicrobiia bacterium]|jgi:hypothetical protein
MAYGIAWDPSSQSRVTKVARPTTLQASPVAHAVKVTAAGADLLP